MFDYLIVGAGFAGSVLAERLAADSGLKVLVVDKRAHIGGNAYDRYNAYGILEHAYGPHIFHTNSGQVFEYLSRFTRWHQYQHRVLASVDGQLVPIPINLDTINTLYGLKLDSHQLQAWFESRAESKAVIRTSEDVVVAKVGRELYEKFFQGYTRKQWGLEPSELDASVAGRIPIRTNRDSRYFSDTYQAMPAQGFTRMFENMLAHTNISVLLNTDYREVLAFLPFRKLIYTGPIDEFFDFRFGPLPYRSLDFQFETYDREWHQTVAQINHPNEYAYTRVTEFKHITGQGHRRTTVLYEFPKGEGEPYYPIPTSSSAAIFKQYQFLAVATKGVHFVGRLATYRYMNMDQAIGQALALYRKISTL